jgi:CMP-N-acetylneuraminic acid synthetase
MFFKDSKHQISNVLDVPTISRRQDLPVAYEPNGAIYIAEINWLLRESSLITSETLGYEMPRERSIDIDNLEDFKLAESYLQKI